MINFGALMKVKGLKDDFEKNHPGVTSFFHKEVLTGLPEGTVVEISLIKPGQDKVTTTMKVNEKDKEIFATLSSLAN